MNMSTEKNNFSSNSFWEEVPDKKARKESFILILEGKLTAEDEEYFPQWKSLLYGLIELNTKEDLMEHFLMPSFAECFFDKILTKAVKSILGCKKLVSKEFNQVLEAILVQTLLLWSKNLHDCPSTLWDIVYGQILQLDNPYYKIKKSMLDLESPLETPAEHFVWLQALKKGDIVDCVKTVELSQQRFSMKAWSQGEIISVNDKSIKVLFLKDREESQKLSKTASCHEIAPYKTKCDDFDWRMNLQPGDIIEACNERGKWYNATVIETRENLTGEKEVLIGLRTYSEFGDKVDSEGRKCFGYLESDKWFNATSPFIAKKNSITNFSTFNTGVSVGDYLDMIFKPSSPEKTVYAIYQEGRCKSITFVNIINQFGERGGFDNLSQTLLDKANPISTENGQKCCQFLSKLDKVLHQTFIREYASKLQDFWGSERQDLSANDQFVKILDSFLRRVYHLKIIKEIVTSLPPVKGLEQPAKALEQMSIDELIDYLEKNGLPQEYLENDIKRNKLFYVDESFLIKRSLTIDSIARLWTVTKPNDKKKIQSMCANILKHYYGSYSPEKSFLMPLVDHLLEANSEDLAKNSIEGLMRMFSSATTVPEGYHQKFFNFLQSSIYNNLKRFSYRLVKSLNTWFARLSNDFLSADEILQILYKYTDNVAQHTLVLPSLNLIQKFSAYKPKADKKFRQESYLEHLCQEKNLIDLVLQGFRFFKQQLFKKRQGHTITEQLLESLLPMKIKYIDDFVSEMTDTVISLHTNYGGNKKLNTMKELWDITFKNSLVPKEKNFILTKIKITIATKKESGMNVDDLKSLMKEVNCIRSLSDLDQPFFAYLHLFVTLHEKLENIYDVMFIASETDLASYKEYRYDKFVRKNNSKEEQPFKFKARTPIDKLEGFDQIWRFMLFAPDDKTSDHAIDFHAMVYSNLDNEFRNRGESLWQGFLTTVKKYLTEILENKQFISMEVLKTRLSRCLQSVIRMLYRTERSIPRELQPHWKLSHRRTIKVPLIDSKLEMNSEQTVQNLLEEYQKKEEYEVDNQVLRNKSLIIPSHKRYLSLFEAGIKGDTELYLEREGPVLGTLIKMGLGLDPRAKILFTKWFEEFSVDGKMSPEQFGMFLQSIGRDLTRDSSLVKDTFAAYDKDRDGLLSLENFLEYYQASCTKNPHLVWKNIATRGDIYGTKRYNFDKFGQVQKTVEPKPDISPSLRSQMAIDNDLFELLSLLRLKGVNLLADWLLQRLPTNPKVFGDIVTLKGVRGVEEPSRRDWDQVFTSKSPHKFLYALDIIDHLFISNMEDDSADETRASMREELDIWTQNTKLLEYKKTWCQDFIELGGSKHLSEVIKAVKRHPDFAKDSSIEDRMDKTTQRVLTYLCFYTEDPKVKK